MLNVFISRKVEISANSEQHFCGEQQHHRVPSSRGPRVAVRSEENGEYDSINRSYTASNSILSCLEKEENVKRMNFLHFNTHETLECK